MNGQTAMCGCGEPLIMTFAWSGYEFYCICCGNQYTFFGPSGEDPTPELDARYEALKAEWDEHVAAKLLPRHSFIDGCERCSPATDEYHIKHATIDEIAAHEEAVAWLIQRRSVAV